MGDSAPRHEPQLGQGVNLGFYDAMVLADCLEEGNTLPKRFPEYSRRRRRHLDFYQFVTRWATPLFSVLHLWLERSSRLRVRLLNAVPVFRRQMIPIDGRFKKGFLRKSLSYFEIPPELGSE